jgi:hypothetical protein
MIAHLPRWIRTRNWRLDPEYRPRCELRCRIFSVPTRSCYMQPGLALEQRFSQVNRETFKSLRKPLYVNWEPPFVLTGRRRSGTHEQHAG